MRGGNGRISGVGQVKLGRSGDGIDDGGLKDKRVGRLCSYSTIDGQDQHVAAGYGPVTEAEVM